MVREMTAEPVRKEVLELCNFVLSLAPELRRQFHWVIGSHHAVVMRESRDGKKTRRGSSPFVTEQELIRSLRERSSMKLRMRDEFSEIASQRGLRMIMSIQTMITIFLVLLLLIPFYA